MFALSSNIEFVYIFRGFLISALVSCAAAGGLVKKILETKKEYDVPQASSSTSKVQVRAISAAG